MTVLAVAAISARMMAEAAAREGLGVVALDLFGDVDTRRACSQWLPIGEAGSLQLDAALALSALRTLARRGDVTGWIAGSGFEGRPELLEQGAGVLPLIGTAPEAVRRVRDPAVFFGFLDAHGIAHPQVQTAAPADAAGWLLKDARGCGGWHIRRAMPRPPEPVSAHHYFQREMRGTPMSATFVANGIDAEVLGFNELIVRHFGVRPFVFCGAVGPVPIATGIAQRVSAAVRALAAEFALRGLCSLDFMLDGDDIGVLEVNPRPPASMALYGGAPTQGVMGAHLRACQRGELPRWAAPDPGRVGGTEIVFARRTVWLNEVAALRLARWPHAHDLPRAGTRFDAGDPLCSLSALGATTGHVRARLDAGCDALREELETLT